MSSDSEEDALSSDFDDGVSQQNEQGMVGKNEIVNDRCGRDSTSNSNTNSNCSNTVNINLNATTSKSTPERTTLQRQYSKIKKLKKEITHLEAQVSELKLVFTADQKKMQELTKANIDHSYMVQRLENRLKLSKEKHKGESEQLQKKLLDEKAKTKQLSEENCNLRGKLSICKAINQSSVTTNNTLKDENSALQNKSVAQQKELDKPKAAKSDSDSSSGSDCDSESDSDSDTGSDDGLGLI